MKTRRHAFLRGVAVSGTSVGNVFTLPRGEARDREIASVKSWIHSAAVLGAPHIRVFAGNVQKGQSPDEAQRLCIEALEECCAFAATQGIFLGLENHGGIVAEPEGLLAIVRAVQSPWLGVNLDTGNFHSADPYAELYPEINARFNTLAAAHTGDVVWVATLLQKALQYSKEPW